ncbi:MAG: alpha/beta hydrolase [Proteobacteria bacterium]|nr:alpha/beta hydrolase [Pseudomonadota bacterium]
MVLNGIELHYLEWGKRTHPPVLLLHGFLSQARIWGDLASILCGNHRVLALNQRGHGKSEWSTDGDYSIDAHFTDLVHFIEHLDLRELVLIGHSMGGRNALFYTACRPERIRKLILVDARLGNSDQSLNALKSMLGNADVADFSHLSIDDAFDRIRSTSEKPIAAGNGSLYDPWLVVASHLADHRVEDLWPFVGNIPCPTWIIRGERSRFLSQTDAETMKHLMPTAEIEVVPLASHLPMLENRQAFNRAVLNCTS